MDPRRGAIGVQSLHPGMHPVTMHRTSAYRTLQGFVIGETGFKPATARPPAGTIQAYTELLGVLEPFQLV
jgi:hypothetical protein